MNRSSDPFSTYLAKLALPWQRQVCERVIASIRTVATFEEDLKWGHPYFAVQGAAAIKLYCAAKWINVYFYRGHELADPSGLFDTDTNSSMRRIKISETPNVDNAALLTLIAQAHALHSKVRRK